MSSGLWIQVSTSFLRHPKLLRCARLLKEDVHTTAGRLIALWTWAMEFSQDGLLEDDSEQIASIMGWQGDPSELINALLLCGGRGAGFIERDESMPDFFQLHHWEDYSGKLRMSARKHAERQRTYREKSRDCHVTVTCSSPCQSRSKKVTGEIEKEIEIENREREDTGGVDPWVNSQLNTISSVISSPSPANLSQVIGKWREVYGAEFTASCISDSMRWLASNGRKYRNMERFIGTWILRETQRRRASTQPKPVRSDKPLSVREILPYMNERYEEERARNEQG